MVEFFSGFVTAASDYGRDWAVHHYGMQGHQSDKADDDAEMADLLAAESIPRWPSGEFVAPLLDGLVTGEEKVIPANIPNTGQVENLDGDVVVECMVAAGADGVRPRDRATVPSFLGEHLRRVVSSQELTVEAAVSGRPDDRPRGHARRSDGGRASLRTRRGHDRRAPGRHRTMVVAVRRLTADGGGRRQRPGPGSPRARTVQRLWWCFLAAAAIR